jgi:hypothetical protein
VVGRYRVRHYGGRVGIDKDNLNSFIFQGSGRLCSGIIKFAGLANNNWARSYYQNLADGSIFWHLKGEMAERRREGRQPLFSYQYNGHYFFVNSQANIFLMLEPFSGLIFQNTDRYALEREYRSTDAPGSIFRIP